MGFLTREEKLVVFALSACLIGGALFQLIGSLFELPEVLTPTVQEPPVSDTKFFTPSNVHPRLGPEEGFRIDEREDRREAERGGASLNGETAGLRADDADVRQQGLPRTTSCDFSGRLDLNKATLAELEALPGIGPTLAARIVKQREETGGFRSVDELLTVPGIGTKTLSKFRDWVCVSRHR